MRLQSLQLLLALSTTLQTSAGRPLEEDSPAAAPALQVREAPDEAALELVRRAAKHGGSSGGKTSVKSDPPSSSTSDPPSITSVTSSSTSSSAAEVPTSSSTAPISSSSVSSQSSSTAPLSSSSISSQSSSSSVDSSSSLASSLTSSVVSAQSSSSSVDSSSSLASSLTSSVVSASQTSPGISSSSLTSGSSSSTITSSASLSSTSTSACSGTTSCSSTSTSTCSGTKSCSATPSATAGYVVFPKDGTSTKDTNNIISALVKYVPENKLQVAGSYDDIAYWIAPISAANATELKKTSVIDSVTPYSPTCSKGCGTFTDNFEAPTPALEFGDSDSASNSTSNSTNVSSTNITTPLNGRSFPARHLPLPAHGLLRSRAIQLAKRAVTWVSFGTATPKRRDKLPTVAAEPALTFVSWPPGKARQNQYVYDSNAGKDTIVYMLDSGADDSHPEFVDVKDSMEWAPFPWNTVSSGSRPAKKPKIDQKGDSSDAENRGHGTSMLAAITGKNLGVAKKVKPIIVRNDFQTTGKKVIDTYTEWLTQLSWILDDWNARSDKSAVGILAMSSGAQIRSRSDRTEPGDEFSQLYKKIIAKYNDLANAGILPIVAAGNTAGNTLEYPALWHGNFQWDSTYPVTSPSIPNMLVVGAVNLDGTQSNRHSKGDEVELYAPGGQKMNVANPNDPNELYVSDTGTSISTAMAAGHAAVIVSNPDFKASLTGKSPKDKVIALRNAMLSDRYTFARSGNVKSIWNGWDGDVASIPKSA